MKKLNFTIINLLMLMIAFSSCNSSNNNSIGVSNSNDSSNTATSNQNNEKKYNVTINISDEEAGIVTGNGKYKSGENVSLSIEPGENFTFSGWYINGELVETNEVYTFNMPNKNLEIDAVLYFINQNGYYVINNVYYNETPVGFEVVSVDEQVSSSVTIVDMIKEKPVNHIKYLSKIGVEIIDVTIGKNITKIDSMAFDSSLVNIYYKGTIEDWCKIKFSNKDANPMFMAEHFFMKNSEDKWKELTNIEIPNTVTKINQYQFYNFASVISIKISDNVTSIGIGAFGKCDSLESITLPFLGNKEEDEKDSIILREIFYLQGGFDSVPEKLKTVIVSGATYIGDRAFEYSSLENVIIHKSVKSFSKNAFVNCGINNFYYSGTIEDWYNISITSLNSNPMTCSKHFYLLNENNDWYEPINIEIPNNMKEIKDYQFSGLESLTNIVLTSNITKIGNCAFESTGLQSITISNNVTIIGRNAFSNCQNLVSIEIPASITKIDSRAFYDCNNLENVYYRGSFEDWCSIDFHDIYSNPLYYTKHFYMLDENNEWYEVKNIVIPNNITSIGNQFTGFKNLTSIVISEGINIIGEDAFNDCSGLTDIYISKSITNVEENAFYKCNNLMNVYYYGTLDDWKNIKFYKDNSSIGLGGLGSSKNPSDPMSYAKNFFILDENGNWINVTDQL